MLMKLQLVRRLNSNLSFHSTIYEMKHCETNKMYILKEVNKPSMDSQKSSAHWIVHGSSEQEKPEEKSSHQEMPEMPEMPDEISNLLRLQTNGVIGINEFIDFGYKAKKEYWVIFEKQDSDLLDYICKYYISESFARKTILSLVDILLDMYHKANLMHMDVKPENILVDYLSGDIKLCDFDFCVPTDTENGYVDMKHLLGTLSYMSPEVLHKICFPTKSVVWSIGLCAYVMYFDVPWDEYCGQASVNDLQFTERWSPEFKQFVLACVSPDVTKRIDLLDIKSHDWLKMPIESETPNASLKTRSLMLTQSL